MSCGKHITGHRGRVFAVATILMVVSAITCAGTDRAYDNAERSAAIAGASFDKVQRWLHEQALTKVDPETGLYSGNWVWNYKDAAADCFPFVVWAAYTTDLDALKGPVLDMLEAEILTCSHIGSIPVSYSFKDAHRWKKGLITDESIERIFFGASEYAKDGLVAIIELIGPEGVGQPYFDRLTSIQKDLWARATVESSHGLLPPHNSLQFLGDQLQVLCRLFAMTGETQYLEWADRIALNYLEDEDFTVRKLTDHGGEIIGALGLWIGVTSEVDPDRAIKYLPKLRRILDDIIASGLNPDGLMLESVAKAPGRHEGSLSSNWGYNYVAFLCYDAVAGDKRYEPYIREALGNLNKPEYKDRLWGGPIDQGRNVPLTTLDQFADSVEGALYLINRVPEPAAIDWADGEIANNVVFADQPDKLWGTTKFESNAVRTVIMHAMMHSRGILARPWQQGLQVGAHPEGDHLAVVVKSNQDWQGRLCFDRPRHQLFMRFGNDWPRMNTVPEWYVVDPNREYRVSFEETGRKETHSGNDLINGLPVSIEAGETVRIAIVPADEGMHP